jgi:1-acyl-sn-glycerol-3-phosphate acyltransferase
MFKKILQYAYNFWTIFNFTWLMLVSVPFIVLSVIINQKIGGRFAFMIMEVWARLFSGLSFIFYKTIGREKLEKGKAYVYTCNHASYLDSPAIIVAVPQQSRPLGKVEILKYPVFGIMFRYIGVTVNRSSPRSRIESLELIKKKLLQGINILIFPEGTMNKTEKTLLPFKDGAFRLAIETNTPIVPMAIHNSRKLFPRGSSRLRAGTIIIEISEPISTNGMTLADVHALKQRTFDITKQMLERGI